MNGMHAFQRAPRAWKSPHHSKTGICAPPRGDFRPVAASKFGNNYTETKTKPQKPAASGLCHEVAPKFSEHKNGWLGRECRSDPSPVRTSANREKNRELYRNKAAKRMGAVKDLYKQKLMRNYLRRKTGIKTN